SVIGYDAFLMRTSRTSPPLCRLWILRLWSALIACAALAVAPSPTAAAEARKPPPAESAPVWQPPPMPSAYREPLLRINGYEQREEYVVSEAEWRRTLGQSGYRQSVASRALLITGGLVTFGGVTALLATFGSMADN